MKKYISVFTIMVMIFLAACSNQNTSSTPTSNENNTQSNSVTKLDEGVWPANEYTEGLPVAPGTVAWATLDLDKRSEERTGWTSKGKLKGTVGDFNKVMEALDFLRQKEISTVESLDAYLDEASAQAVSIREEIRPMEKRVKEIDRLLFHIGNFEANKPVHAKYAAIRWKKPKEKFAADHKEELDAYNAALRYFKVHLDGAKYSTKKLAGEQAQLSENIASKTEALTAVQEDVKILRDVRHWLNQVLPSEQYRQTAEPGKKPSIQQAVKGREQRIREEQAEKHQQPRRQQKQDMEL